MKHSLEADGIELSFGSRKILSDIYICCASGEITGLLGRNGQGKSCLMNIIYGSLKAQSRSIRFNDQSEFEAFKNPSLLSYLPQFSFIPPSLTLKRVFNDFELSFVDFELFLPEFLGRINAKIASLSGGERRLVEVYLIIKSKSAYTILDEPFSHIMPLHIEKIKALIISEKTNKGFFITDHMYQSIIDISNRTYVLKDGKTHFTHSTADIEWLGYARF
jgi:ABC-type lipopolysaccharide export system ATPase subunit